MKVDSVGLPLHCVVAQTVSEAVVHAGGWLFDQAASGLQTAAILLEPAEGNTLAILGATSTTLESSLADIDFDSGPLVVVMPARLYDTDRRVRDLAKRLFANRRAVVFFCAADDEDTAVVRYPLSYGARAFKAAALRAIGHVNGAADDVEIFIASARLRSATATSENVQASTRLVAKSRGA